MKEYTMIVKSHCEGEDYEDTVLAKSRMQAARKLQRRANFGAEEPIGLDFVLENMESGDAV